MMETTLNKLKTINFDNIPSSDVDKLLKYLNKTEPDDEPLSISTILDAIGFHSALRCLVAVDGCKKQKLLLNHAYASEISRFMPKKSQESLDILKKYADESISKDEFLKAYDSAVVSAKSSVDGDWTKNAAAHVAAMAFFSECNDVAYEVAVVCKFIDGVIPKQKQEDQLREILKQTCQG